MKTSHTKRLLKDAIKGGWKHAYDNGGTKTTGVLDPQDLLDPNFWQSVGKTRKWDYVYTDDEETVIDAEMGEEMLNVPGYGRWIGWKYYAHSFFMGRMAGLTIEEAIKTI